MKRPTNRLKPTVEANPESELLTAVQVMAWLGVSRTALWLLMRQRGLPYVKYGTSRRAALRFSRASINKWIAQNEYQAIG